MDATGLMGDFSSGDMYSRDGEEILDFEHFGFEWQVNPTDPKLFRDARSPQLPYEQCRMPTAPRPARRRLRENSELFQQAREACASQEGSDFDLCVDDVMITGDLGIAGAW